MKITRAPILILVVAFCVRAGWALFVPVMPLSDSYAYDTFAQNLANGLGYGWNAGEPTVFWMPGTAMVYALFYRTFGHAYSPIVILNVLLGVWIVLAAMWLSEKWFDARTGLVTGWLLALWPNLIQFTSILASELLFMALVLAALLLWQFCSACGGSVRAQSALCSRARSMCVPSGCSFPPRCCGWIGWNRAASVRAFQRLWSHCSSCLF